MEEAHRAMRDDDMWVIPPEMRLEATDEEAVEEWRNIPELSRSLANSATTINNK
jgi:hypothetical protein